MMAADYRHIGLVGTTADFWRFGPPRPLQVNHLPCENCAMLGRIGEVGLNWSRAFLSKTRFMSGRQCAKKLWQTVYAPEPAEEPAAGTVKGMGIEVGIKARLLWP